MFLFSFASERNLYAHSTQVLLVRSDGLDQAKHKVPRSLVQSKTFSELVRPACHVMMTWCHGFSFQFGIADPDCFKDSSYHMDALARSMSVIYDQVKGLPKHYFHIMDNTSSSNKNQFMMKWFIKLVMMGVFQTATALFPIKGHTHGPLDAVGGHAVVRCSHETFETSDELVTVYNNFLQQASFERGTFDSSAYKQDDAADWHPWVNEVPLNFKYLTGPRAPHGFRFLKRKHLNPSEAAIPDDTMPYGQTQGPDDVMMLTYNYMSDPLPFQVITLFGSFVYMNSQSSLFHF